MNSRAGCENTPSISLGDDTFYYTPGIGATSDLSSFTLHLNVTTNYCKGDTVLQREGKRIRNQPWKKSQGDMFEALGKSQTTNLQYLVLSLKVFFFIGVTLWKLVDVDPELLYFLFDLQHTTTSV